MTCDPRRRKTAPRPSFRASAKQKESKMARKRPKINTSVYPFFLWKVFHSSRTAQEQQDDSCGFEGCCFAHVEKSSMFGAHI